MNKRQKKKHIKKALRLSIISIELADKYLRRYKVKGTYNCDIWLSVLKRRTKREQRTTKAL